MYERRILTYAILLYGINEHNSYYDYMCISEHNSYASIELFLTNTIHMRLLSEHIYNLIIEYYFMCIEFDKYIENSYILYIKLLCYILN